MSNGTILTTMKNAEVLIELEKLDGDVLTATCTAVFEMETDMNAPMEGQTLLVAFPLTLNHSSVVKVADFELIIDGVRKSDLESSYLLLSSKKIDPSTIFWGPPPISIKTLEVDPQLGELFGYRVRDDFPAKGPVLSNTYTWQQTFLPGATCVVQIKYRMTLYAQSLAYSKKLLKGQSRNIVPFDLMWAGASDEKGFFLDYILRSGSTWNGPIGHETVILRAAKKSRIIFNPRQVVTVGRHRFAGTQEDLRESKLLSSIGINAPGLKNQSDSIVWTIDNEDPQHDILVQIPTSAVQVSERP